MGALDVLNIIFPAGKLVAITASDTVDDPNGPFRGLYVGGSGAVKLTDRSGSTVTLPAVAAGAILPVRFKRVFATGTTATGLFGSKEGY